MHIVFHTHEYPSGNRYHGGIGTVVKFLANRYVALGHRVSVVGLNNTTQDEFEKDGEIEIYRLAKSTWPKLKFIDHNKRIQSTLRKIHAKHPIDIVEGAELTFAFYPPRTPFKKVIRLHGGHHFFALELGKKPAFWRSFQEKQSFKKADGYIAVSDYVGKQTQKYLRNPFSYEVIFNTLDIQKFNLSAQDKVMKNRLLFVGTVCEKKGIRQLIMAMPEIIKAVPDVHLDVVGRDWHFPGGRSYTEYLKTLMDDQTASHITFHGAVPHEQVKSFIDRAEVCVYPSHMEAMPLAWIEVLLSGKPFVGGDIGPGREIVRHGETGLLANPKDPQDIAHKVIRMLRNKEQSRQMGLRAREHILQILHPDKIIRQNLEFYGRLLE